VSLGQVFRFDVNAKFDREVESVGTLGGPDVCVNRPVKCLIKAVVSMGRRNTQLGPALH
jgi:hypothetical protein